MSKKKKNQEKTSRNNLHTIIKVIPTWLKFIGLLVPILGLIVSFLGYTLEKQKYSDNLQVLVSTASNKNVEGIKIEATPGSVSFVTEKITYLWARINNL